MHSTYLFLTAVTCLSVSVCGHVIRPLTFRAQSLRDCLSAKSVPTYTNSSNEWTTLQEPYNLALNYEPVAITLPKTPQHVADSVICASSAGVKVQPKSGGHSYASYSSGGKDGSLIVDLYQFSNITLDKSTNIVAVGGGQRLGNLATAIFNQGARALPHGTCPGVGVGGHFTHGGFGYDSRIWGLSLDTIVAMDVVLANGSIVHTTQSSYPEIYYALRGAADSFGIVTTFYLQTLPAPSSVVVFSINLSQVTKNAATATAGFLKLQDFVLNSPLMDRNLNLGMYIDSSSFSISGWFFGNQTYFNTTILPEMIAGFPAPSASSISITSQHWIQALTTEAGSDPLIEPLEGYDLHDTFYAKSITTKQTKPLTKAALTAFFKYLYGAGANAANPWFSIINLYGGKDSQINIRDINFSAYKDRDSLWVFQNYGFTSNNKPPFNQNIVTFVDGMNSALVNAQSDGEFGAYLNYVDPRLSATEAATLYYGKDLYEKLAALKKRVDPKSVFWNPQAIGSAKI